MTDYVSPGKMSAERLAEIHKRASKTSAEPNFDHMYSLPLVDCWALFDHIEALQEENDRLSGKNVPGLKIDKEIP